MQDWGEHTERETEREREREKREGDAHLSAVSQSISFIKPKKISRAKISLYMGVQVPFFSSTHIIHSCFFTSNIFFTSNPFFFFFFLFLGEDFASILLIFWKKTFFKNFYPLLFWIISIHGFSLSRASNCVLEFFLFLL